MSQISDKIQEVAQHFDAAEARVQAAEAARQTEIQTLTDKVAELQALIDSGQASASDIAAMQSFEDRLDKLDAAPAPTPPPAPGP